MALSGSGQRHIYFYYSQTGYKQYKPIVLCSVIFNKTIEGTNPNEEREVFFVLHALVQPIHKKI